MGYIDPMTIFSQSRTVGGLSKHFVTNTVLQEISSSSGKNDDYSILILVNQLVHSYTSNVNCKAQY